MSVWRDATVVPTYRDGATLRGGLLVRRWWRLAPVPESRLMRGGKPHIAEPQAERVPARRPRIEAEALVAGHLFDSYGHFLLESLARLGAARDRPDLPLLWINAVPTRTWQRDLLALLEVDRPVLDLGGRATDLAVAHLPPPGFEIRSFVTEDHARFLARVEPGPPGDERVWLSRSRLPPDRGRVEEDPEIEAALERRGWRILHPQDHPLREQVEILGRARRLAGWASSAFHTLLLLRSVPARVDLLARGEALNPNYRIIARARGLDQHEHAPPLRRLGGAGSKTRWSADPREVVALLDP